MHFLTKNVQIFRKLKEYTKLHFEISRRAEPTAEATETIITTINQNRFIIAKVGRA